MRNHSRSFAYFISDKQGLNVATTGHVCMLTHSKLMHQVDSFMPPDSKVQKCLRNDESRSSARRWDMDTSHSPTSEEYIEQRMEGLFGGSKMMVETC